MSFDHSFAGYVFAVGQGHMLGAASLTLFLYDILLTIDQEITLIHKGARWSLPKILYLLNRYYVLTIMILNTLVLFLPTPSDQFCVFAVRYSGIGGILGKFILDVWLILRVYAIWGRNHKVLCFLGVIFFCNVCISCIMAGFSLNALRPIALPGPRPPKNLITGCIVFSPNTNFWIVFVSSLIFEVIIFTLTMWKAVIHMKAGFRTSDTPLFTHLYRTGVMYFAVMALTMAFMSSTALTPLQNVVLPGQFLCAFVSTVCARMMLGIRSVIQGDDHFSDLRPSDIQISHFRLTPLSLSSGRAREEQPPGYIDMTNDEAVSQAQKVPHTDIVRIPTSADAWTED